LTVGDAGVGGGGLGVAIGIVAVDADSALVVLSSQDSATSMEFVRTRGAWASGDEMVSLSRDDCNAEADVEVIAAGIVPYVSTKLGMQCEMEGMGNNTQTGYLFISGHDRRCASWYACNIFIADCAYGLDRS
jgi:hypothetical protein